MVIGIASAVVMRFSLPFVAIALVIAIFVVLNVLTLLRLRYLRQPVTDHELFLHLFSDVIILAALFYFTGGSTNPFVSLFLVPLVLAAASLPARYTWAIAVAALSSYSLLMMWYIPLPHQHGENFNQHVLGMWFGFLLSATLISYFAVKMSATLREREQALAQAREDALRDDRLVALGTLAAGAAHELGTPLATMAVLVKDLEMECGASPALAKPLSVLRSQITRCKDILAKLAVTAGQSRAESGRTYALDQYLEQIAAGWQSSRPGVELQRHWEGVRPVPQVVVDQTLTHAITNILNNAADASERFVEIKGNWSHDELILDVCDRGAGLSEAVIAHAGEPFFTTKPPGMGMGLGLFLAQSAVQRLGGTMQLSNRTGGGACVRVTLPLSSLLLQP